MKRLWRKFIRFITRDYSKPVQDYGSHGNDLPELKLNWGIVVPHTKRKPGASGYRPNSSKIHEYYYGLEMVNTMFFPFETRDHGGIYKAVKRMTVCAVNAILEPHLNAFNTKAKGFEILVMKGDYLSAKYARKIIEAFHQEFPDRVLRGDNGIKWVSKGENGWHNMNEHKKAGAEVALLSEGFFIDNPNEWIEPERMAEFWNKTLKSI